LITNLLASGQDTARAQLQAIGGIVSALIASEAPKDDPIVIWGVGPRIRIYCLFGEDALIADDKNEDGLPHCPTNGDWRMSFPCSKDDLSWVQAELEQSSDRFSTRSLGESIEAPEPSAHDTDTFQLDKDVYFRA
jgi:hypothetical protein